jgi:hypothetical protein
MSLGPGLHFDVSSDAYHGDPTPDIALSASVAHTLVSKSPMHAWLQHPKLGGKSKDPTRAMDLGSVVHALLLGAGKGFAVIKNPRAGELDPKTKEPEGEFEDFKRKAAKEARDMARSEGKVPLLLHQAEEANEIATRIRERLWAEFRIRLDGASEVVAIWKDDGVWCRGAFDHLKEDEAHILDLKIVRSAHPKACQSHLVGFGGDIQAAAYMSALRTLRPELAGRERFTFLFCEAEEPHAITPVIVRGSMRELGERRWNRAKPLWRNCLRSKQWPGYVTEPIAVEAPAWAMFAEEDAAFANFGGTHDEPEGPSDSAPSNGDSDEYGTESIDGIF